MLFNSYIFIFAFLPVTLWGYFFLARLKGGEVALFFLVLASLFFYGWWNPVYLILILCSILINYLIGESLSRFVRQKKTSIAKTLLLLGIAGNLAVLGYYKYINFFIENINGLLEIDILFEKTVLPLAISFFTFQQIAYLVDAYKRVTEELRFIHYALFVIFFPQLIAGPIVHHKEMLPQFLQMENLKPKLENILIGLIIFSLGLFKKAVLADSIAQYSTPVFQLAEAGESLTFFVAWGGALAYTFQLYFDFSGYSDMAIGIAYMFGIQLPLNFASPYKSLNIIEFWRRWHITLSRFLREYIYFPLGGNRKGSFRRFFNLLATMLLGGLWHGAGWTFVIWGGLHGLYLIINHFWKSIKSILKLHFLDANWLWLAFAWLLTFISVVNSWIFFRAESLSSAFRILEGMYGFNGVALPNAIYTRLGSIKYILSEVGITSYIGGGTQFIFTYLWVLCSVFVGILLPNTQQIMKHFVESADLGPAIFNQGIASKRLTFCFNIGWSVVMSIVLVVSVFALARVSEFLYFQF